MRPAAVAVLLAAALASLVARGPAPALAAPLPKALSEVGIVDARLQNVNSEFYVKLRDGAAPVTARTTHAEAKHFNLTVVRFMDMQQDDLWAVRSRDSKAYLAVDENGARSDVLPDSKMNKDDARHVLFRKKTTSCADTVAFESMTERGKFLTERCADEAAESCSLHLAPLDASAPGDSVCLSDNRALPKSILFKEV
ncbi:hypothetical protein R5R35_013563 [Gryllus longicercus]|uniref:Accessory gland protein n=1 Tax=Gryllus longicercus TaxID=2509291 RepID=A0AAN9VXQ8_9ORTH